MAFPNNKGAILSFQVPQKKIRKGKHFSTSIFKSLPSRSVIKNNGKRAEEELDGVREWFRFGWEAQKPKFKH